MFLRENFEIFKWAVKIYTSSDKEEPKSGLKAGLHYLIKDAAEKCMGVYLGKNDDDSAAKVRKFMVLLKLRKDKIFADAMYNLNKRRNVKNRQPSEAPDEDDILTINEYIIKRMGEITNDSFLQIDMHLHVELRYCTNTRLIVFTGRRGGKPSCLTINEWKKAENDVWLDKKRLNEIPEEATNGAKITFQTGKRINRLLSLIIPKDTIKAMQVLCDQVVRSNAAVKESNSYVFPSTQQSDNHFSGGHSFDNVCQKLPIIKHNINGTKNWHRLNTLIAGLDLTENEMELAYAHFSYSGDINKNIYQVPQAHQQLLSMAKYLTSVDQRIISLLEGLAINSG